MRTLIRFLFTVAVVGLVILGGAWWWAGRMDGPAVDLKTPQKFIGHATPLEMSWRRRTASSRAWTSRSNRTARPSRCSRSSSRGRPRCGRRRPNASTSCGRSASRRSPSCSRSRADRCAPRGRCSTACARLEIDGDPRRGGAARAAARRRALDLSLHQPRRQRVRRLSRHARRRRVGRPRRRQGVSRLSRPAAPASTAIRRCAWRSSPCCTTRT